MAATYGGDLRRLFPERRIEVVDEQPAVSTYRMHGDGGAHRHDNRRGVPPRMFGWQGHRHPRL